jgi:hypothetical protein
MVTAVGSLPHDNAREAARFVLRVNPQLPAAPQLLNVDPREGMLAQAAWGMPGVDVLDDGTLRVADPSRLDCELREPESLTGPPFSGLRTFLDLLVEVGHQGVVKLQSTGPITLGAVLVDAGVPPGLAFRAALAAVRRRVGALLDLGASRLPDASWVLVLDEPAFAAVGTPAVPLDLEDAVDTLSSALAAGEDRSLTAVHCCGAADWEAILRAGPHALSLPVALAKPLPPLAAARFLERGGWFLWGAIPTDGPLSAEVGRYWRALWSRWIDLIEGGCDPVLVRARSLVTPACGLGNHDVAQLAAIFRLCAELGLRIRGGESGLAVTPLR